MNKTVDIKDEEEVETAISNCEILSEFVEADDLEDSVAAASELIENIWEVIEEVFAWGDYEKIGKSVSNLFKV